MIEAGSIVAGASGRYATALFSLASDSGALAALEADMRRLDEAITGSADLRRLIKSPLYSRAVQARALAEVAAHLGLSSLTQRFLGVVAHNRRLFVLNAIIADVLKLIAHARGETAAIVTSARPLSEPQKRSLEAGLKQALGRAVRLEAKTDPDVLGGLMIRVGSVMIDATLKSQLSSLKTAMREAS